MKTSLYIAIAALGLSVSAPAFADFSGGYAVSNWTTTLNGGSISTAGAPSSIRLTSADDYSFLSKNQDLTISALGNGTVSFSWSFFTTDTHPVYDPFGFLLNGSFSRLSSIASSEFSQTGSYSVDVLAGDVFGFRASSVDSSWGASTTTVSNFTFATAVPEPETYAMLLAGLGLLGFTARRRKDLAA